MLAGRPNYPGGAENPFKEIVSISTRGKNLKNFTSENFVFFLHLLLLVDLALAARPLVQHRTLQLRPALPTLLHLAIIISKDMAAYQSDKDS